ncbi:MAG: DUF5009 domain-containing protein [Planctomycetes bacterium]|nr:DUF5009 domain-containing protein [Planctomycetota bacterium]
MDVYRGMVMFLMLAEVLHWNRLREFKDGVSPWIQSVFEWVSFHTSHVEWRGCSLHDMIQPSFSFLVGTSLAFSYTKRVASGQSWGKMFLHACWRSLILIFLGVFLRSLGKPQTNFTFDDTLTQIGLGYWILFMLASLSMRWLIATVALILLLTWGAFVAFPLPASEFDYASVGVPTTWTHHADGFGAHWNKNSNLAWAFDTWWMNLFPREKPFLFSGGGYSTLSFVPTLATMTLGLIAGSLLRQEMSESSRSFYFLIAAAVCLSVAWGLDHFGICPIVKRIWTPSWTLWSGGLCFVWFLALHWLCDTQEFTKWTYFWTVIGANSIAAYVMSWTLEKPTHDAIERHFGALLDSIAVEPVQPMLTGAITLALFWCILRWMYRQGIFVRI